MSEKLPRIGVTTRVERDGEDVFQVELDALHLRVIEGDDAGKEVRFSLPAVRIGKAVDNDLVLTDGSVSGHHLVLEYGSRGLRIRDLGSTNGTFVGDLEVGEARLEPGSRFRLGRTVIEVNPETTCFWSPVGEEAGLGELVGGSRAMRDLYALLLAVAPAPATVLIHGESGTGKELVARELHARSGRKGPLVIFDAATADPAMVRSDLFGHLKGAFTGAEAARKGAFREADGGTLFMDEIGELPLDLQPRLLRVLESREVTPLGSDRRQPVDVRVVTATHRDLKQMVSEGTFREDLFHRLSVVTLEVPPLRERLEDVPLLIETMLTKLGGSLDLSEEAGRVLETHDWPGNVRALRNLLERLMAICRGRTVEVGDLGLESTGTVPVPRPPGGGDSVKMQDVERQTILDALVRHGGSRMLAAEELGMSLSTLKRRLRKYKAEGIEVPPPKS